MTYSQMQLPFQRRLLSNNAMPGKKIRCVICYYAKITDILSFLDIFVYNNLTIIMILYLYFHYLLENILQFLYLKN